MTRRVDFIEASGAGLAVVVAASLFVMTAPERAEAGFLILDRSGQQMAPDAAGDDVLPPEPAPAAPATADPQAPVPLSRPAASDRPQAEPLAPVPVEAGTPEQGAIIGFGSGIPLEAVVTDLVPAEYEIAWVPGVDRMQPADWEGGTDWQGVLARTLDPLALDYVADGLRLTIGPAEAGAAAAMPPAAPVSPAMPAPGPVGMQDAAPVDPGAPVPLTRAPAAASNDGGMADAGVAVDDAISGIEPPPGIGLDEAEMQAGPVVAREPGPGSTGAPFRPGPRPDPASAQQAGAPALPPMMPPAPQAGEMAALDEDMAGTEDMGADGAAAGGRLPPPPPRSPAAQQTAQSAPVEFVDGVPQIRARPVTTSEPLEWYVRSNSTLRNTLEEWAASAGWDVAWQTERDWMIEASATLEGNFETAAANLLRAFRGAIPPVRGVFFGGNRVLVVTAPGQDVTY